MENRKLLEIVPLGHLTKMTEEFCSENPIMPLAIFHAKWVGNGYNPKKTIADVADRVFGYGKTKILTFNDGWIQDMTWHTDVLKAMPHRLILIYGHADYNGYDNMMLYAEKLAKATRKHVILMIPITNILTEEQLFTGKFMYQDYASQTFLSWQGRVRMWVADRPNGYSQTRQAYLAWCRAGVLDMLKDWSEDGRCDDIRTALEDKEWLNAAYRQYVASREDVPYILKYATFDEQLVVEDTDTEYGRVTTVKAANLQNVSGADENRCTRALKVITELRLSL